MNESNVRASQEEILAAKTTCDFDEKQAYIQSHASGMKDKKYKNNKEFEAELDKSFGMMKNLFSCMSKQGLTKRKVPVE
ncbi:hypothetical protein [Veronia pacifica]|uniref:Uncharacterized protein n=1 Tax=Veronia pacifica TaxID=1080227 RepID=A0A1C3EL79_9GAMM|nr:hypothetical protein [Veronia pacifica]ODA33998.1 hypothetical protein A8L45_08100 [Veronia pacifica]